jgi:hypothetical protein
MLGKHHAHLELPKVKVATIKLFHDFQRLHDTLPSPVVNPFEGSPM